MNKHEMWLKWLKEEKRQIYFQDILKRVEKIEKAHLLYPSLEDRFASLNFPDITQIKAIITESRPMVEPYAADGLAWSSLDLPTQEMQLMYKKLYQELGIIYNQLDHTKNRWASQGILLLPIELTSPLDQSLQTTLWEEFTFSVLQAFLNSSQKRYFLFLDEQQDWRVLNNPYHHPILNTSIYSTEPIFLPITDFISRHYGIIMDWS